MPKFFNPLEVMRLRNDAGIRNNSVGATFGPDVRRYPDGSPKKHQGWDLYAPEKTPAYAVADGIVVWKRNGGDYGLQLLIQFDTESNSNTSSSSTLYAFYAHLSEITVEEAAIVRAGQKIAATGISGNADAKYPHLHFEIRDVPSQNITGLVGRVDPSSVLGAQLLSCTTEVIGGIDTVQMVCRVNDNATSVAH